MVKKFSLLVALTIPFSIAHSGDAPTAPAQAPLAESNGKAPIEAREAASHGKAPIAAAEASQGKAPIAQGKAPIHDPKAPIHIEEDVAIDPYDLYPDPFVLEPEWMLWKHMHLGARFRQPISPANPGIRRSR